MISASITITINEFDDILCETIDRVVTQHGNEISQHLQSFLISMGSMQVQYSTGKIQEWRF